ncbi:La- protein 4 [Mortierella claussenii]|nr:La- protein 4 [Mortierella claussenii]
MNIGVYDDQGDCRDALREQLEWYFSPRNLATDSYLADFKKVKAITNDICQVVYALQRSSTVLVDESETMVKPVTIDRPRTTLILRELPEDTDKEEIAAVFTDAKCPAKSIMREVVGNMWFVEFSTAEDALAMLNYTRGRHLRNVPIAARLKSNTVLTGGEYRSQKPLSILETKSVPERSPTHSWDSSSTSSSPDPFVFGMTVPYRRFPAEESYETQEVWSSSRVQSAQPMHEIPSHSSTHHAYPPQTCFPSPAFAMIPTTAAGGAYPVVHGPIWMPPPTLTMPLQDPAGSHQHRVDYYSMHPEHAQPLPYGSLSGNMEFDPRIEKGKSHGGDGGVRRRGSKDYKKANSDGSGEWHYRQHQSLSQQNEFNRPTGHHDQLQRRQQQQYEHGYQGGATQYEYHEYAEYHRHGYRQHQANYQREQHQHNRRNQQSGLSFGQNHLRSANAQQQTRTWSNNEATLEQSASNADQPSSSSTKKTSKKKKPKNRGARNRQQQNGGKNDSQDNSESALGAGSGNKSTHDSEKGLMTEQANIEAVTRVDGEEETEHFKVQVTEASGNKPDTLVTTEFSEQGQMDGLTKDEAKKSTTTTHSKAAFGRRRASNAKAQQDEKLVTASSSVETDSFPPLPSASHGRGGSSNSRSRSPLQKSSKWVHRPGIAANMHSLHEYTAAQIVDQQSGAIPNNAHPQTTFSLELEQAQEHDEEAGFNKTISDSSTVKPMGSFSYASALKTLQPQQQLQQQQEAPLEGVTPTMTNNGQAGAESRKGGSI